MANIPALAVGAAAILCTLALVGKGTSLANMVRLLSITPKLNGKPKFSFTTITLPMAVDIENRSDQEITMGITSLIVYYNGTKIATTKPTDTSVVIKKYSTSTLSGLKVDIGYFSLLSVVKDIPEIIRSGDYSGFLSRVSLNITCILNDSIVFDISPALGESKQVQVGDKSTKVSGLGDDATGFRAEDRVMHGTLNDYIGLIPDRSELRKRDLIVNVDASVMDTARLMHTVARKYRGDTARLAAHLRKATLRATLQNIWDFVANHIRYERDSPVREQVRRPLRTLYDQKGDCDCYSTLIGSMLENLCIPYKFRLAAYKGDYQHVYVVVPDENGNMLPVDPVNEFCFKEKKPTKHIDI